MASEINTNELNRLQNDGRISNDTIEVDDKKIFEEVESGKKTTEELPQIIPATRILDEVQHIEIYKLILGPCATEGFSVNQKLLEIFENKKIKPTDLEDELNNAMQEIIQYVNQNDRYAVVFLNDGKIDVEESVQKAQRTNHKVSAYITSLAEDSGKSVEELRAKETIFGLDVARNKSVEECAWLDHVFQEDIQEYREKNEKVFSAFNEIEVRKNNKGEDLYVDKNSEDVTILLNIAKRLDGWLGKIPEDIGQRDKFVLDMITIYNYISNPDLLSNLPAKNREAFLQLIDNAKEIIEKRFEGYPGGSIKDESKINEILTDLHKDRADVEDITKTQIYTEIKDDLRQLNIAEISLDVVEQRKKVSLDTVMSICKISDYSLHFTGTTNKSLIRRTALNNGRIIDTVTNLYPDYAEQAKENAKLDGYALVRLSALREIEAEKILLEKEDDSKHTASTLSGEMSISEYNKLRVAVGILNSRGFTKELRELAVNTIKEHLPEIEIDDEVVKSLVANSDSQKLNLISDMVQQEAMHKTFSGKNPMNILSGNDFAFTGMAFVDARVKGKLLKEIHDASTKGEDLNIEVFESEKYKKLVENGIKEYDTKFFETKKLEYLIREIKIHAKVVDEKQYKKEKNIDIEQTNKIDENDVVFAKKLIEAAKMLSGKKASAIDRMVREYLVDYIPEAFDKDGNIIIDEIDEHYEKFLYKNGISEDRIPPIVEKIEKDIDIAFNDEIEKHKITTDVVSQAMEAEAKIRKDLGFETRLEQIEDTVMFTNYILSKKDGLSKESQEELEGHVKAIGEILDKQHRSTLECAKKTGADLIGEHENYDKNRVKSKFVYLEKEARRVVATERVAEKLDRFKQTKIINPYLTDEIKGILGTYMGILNDYKNEELKVDEYNSLMGNLKTLIQKVDPRLVDKDGNIDEDKVLDKYNEVYGTDYKDIDSVSKYEETELLMRYTRRLSKEMGTQNLTYRNIIYDNDLYVNSKIHEKLQEDVHLNTETTNRLISDVWSFVSVDVKRQLTADEMLNYIKNLALIEGLYGKKDLNKKGLSYEANIVQELQKKTLGIARIKLAEIFPEVAREKDTFDITKLEESLREYLIQNDPELRDQAIKDGNVLKLITKDKETNSILFMGPAPKQKTTVQLLEEANAVLKGEEKEKTYEDNVLIASMTIKLLGEIGKPEMGDRLLGRLTRNMSDSEKDKFVQDCNAKNVDNNTLNAMRRVAGLINIERYKEELEMDSSGISKVPMNEDDIADYLQIAVGALASCDELSNTEINLSAQKDITDFIKLLAPKTVNSKGKVDYKKLMNVVSDLRSKRPDKDGNYDKFESKEDFINNSIRKANVRMGIELFRGKIDSRFTNKYYVPVESKDEVVRPIFDAEMDKVIEERGEEIVIAEEVVRVPNEEKKKTEDVLISEGEFGGMFEEIAVEIGEAETKKVEEPMPEINETSTHKVEQQVNNPSTEVTAENIEVADDTWRENLPVKQKQKGFFGNIFDKIKDGIKTVKEKIFGTAENNVTSNGNNDNNNNTTGTSGTGGVNKDEQNVEALTGHGKIKLEFGAPTIQTSGTESKGKDPKSGGETEHDEEVL